jgi:hypothetical protein
VLIVSSRPYVLGRSSPLAPQEQGWCVYYSTKVRKTQDL